MLKRSKNYYYFVVIFFAVSVVFADSPQDKALTDFKNFIGNVVGDLKKLATELKSSKNISSQKFSNRIESVKNNLVQDINNINKKLNNLTLMGPISSLLEKAQLKKEGNSREIIYIPLVDENIFSIDLDNNSLTIKGSAITSLVGIKDSVHKLGTKLSNIKKLTIQCPHLVKINKDDLSGFEYVENLTFKNRNSLTTIEDGAFDGMKAEKIFVHGLEESPAGYLQKLDLNTRKYLLKLELAIENKGRARFFFAQ